MPFIRLRGIRAYFSCKTTQAGQVKDMEYNTEIFPRGFATGLRKLLSEVDD
ncbi:hypothetical protein LZG54_02765 [Acinetobacter towneri]|nr:hypothetical protein LZG54_02765 [Acinetobacter towneri]